MSKQLQAVYSATSVGEQEVAYDNWASAYERDLHEQGYTLPSLCSVLFATFVEQRNGPFCDAGCGTGMQLEPLFASGFRGFTGLDLSSGMLSVARKKGLYERLIQATMGERLPFEDNQFVASLTCGAITQGHAPAKSFDELVRITRPGGKVVFTLRCDSGIDPSYAAHVQGLTDQGQWKCVHETAEQITFPLGEETHVRHKGWVFEIC